MHLAQPTRLSKPKTLSVLLQANLFDMDSSPVLASLLTEEQVINEQSVIISTGIRSAEAAVATLDTSE